MFLYSKGLIETLLNHRYPLNDLLEYSSSPPFSSEWTVENVFNYQRKDLGLATEDPNHFLKFGFKNVSITLKAYKITSVNVEFGSHLKSWHLYGSNGSNWELLDYVENDRQLNGSSYSAIYHIKEEKGPFKFFKLDNVTTFHIQKKILIADIDVYDTLFSPLFIYRITCKENTYHFLKHFQCLFLFILESN